MRTMADWLLSAAMFVTFYLAFSDQLWQLWGKIWGTGGEDPQDGLRLWSRLRELSKGPWQIKHKGLVKITPVLYAIVVASMMVAMLSASYHNPGSSKVVELHNVRVLRDIGRYDYWLQAENGQKFYTTFCADYEPQFSKGQTLLVLKYEDRGNCWSVANTHPAYLIERDENGKPTLH